MTSIYFLITNIFDYQSYLSEYQHFLLIMFPLFCAHQLHIEYFKANLSFTSFHLQLKHILYISIYYATALCAYLF